MRKCSSVRTEKEGGGLFDLENIVFMGTSVISGSGTVLVVRTGDGEFSASGGVNLICCRDF